MKLHIILLILEYCLLVFVTGSRHPNVLLIVVDDLRPTIGCYGDSLALTHNIDALAQRGTLFTQAFAQQALCGPSRTSFLTSRRPDTTRLYDVHSYWRNHAGNFTTLPQYFKDHGYHTVSAGKIFHPGIASNHTDDQPYSWSEEPYHPSSQVHKQDPVCLGADGVPHTNIYCPVEIDQQPDKTLPDIQTTQFAVSWLKNRAHNRKNSNLANEHQPFFLAVGYHKPHIPLKFPWQFLDAYPIADIPLAPNNYKPHGLPAVAWNPWNDLRRRDDIKDLNVSFPFGPLPDTYARYIRQGYYAATSYTDSLIGDLLATTDEHFPQTIVALIGDHGWSLGEHHEWSKFSNFEVSTRVPFIVAPLDEFPGPAFRRFSHIFMSSDGGYRFNSSYFSTTYKYKTSTTESVHITQRKNSVKEAETARRPHVDSLVELVDLFPTLVDLAGITALDTCPDQSQNISACTEGSSLSPIIHHIWEQEKLNIDLLNLNKSMASSKTVKTENTFVSIKKAAFSQYPRPGIHPTITPDSDQPRLKEIKVMGYSMRTQRYRYTVWLRFNRATFRPDWNWIVAEELYDHEVDPEENHNLCQKRSYRAVKKKLLKILAQGWKKAQKS